MRSRATDVTSLCSMRLRILGVVLTCLVCFMPAKARVAEQPSISIIVPKEADAVVEFAARDLARYLKLVVAEPVETGHAPARHHIYLGEIPPNLPSAQARRLREAAEKLQEDGFIIRSIGADVAILGRGSRGNLYGSYAFLERQGVRWFFPGKQFEVVPHHALNWADQLNVSESPAFPKRILFYWPNNYSSVADWIDFSAKVRLNRLAFHYTWPAMDWYILLQSQVLPELRKRGMEIEAGGHFLSTFMPRTLFAQHPEWFRIDEQGKRVNDFNFDPFNLEALDYLSGGATDYLGRMPGVSLFHLWADDIEGGGWTHEPGKEDYTASDQALLVTNYLVKRLREKLPNATLAFLAYHDTVYPPRVVKPEPGVIYFYAPRERCYAHALNDSACGLNRKYARALEAGLPAFGAANAEVFEYYADQILYESITNPPIPEVLSADLRYYHQLGIPAVGALMTNTSNFVTPMVNMFLYPQALWDPQRDLSQSLVDYASRYFGDPGMGNYFQELSRGLRSVLQVCHYEHPGDAWDEVRVDKETDEALEYHVRGLQDALQGPLARADTTLRHAARGAKDKIKQERFAGEQVSMNFTLLQARLYYHLLKGERLYRTWRSQHDREAGLGVLTELALARHSWECEKKFVAISGMKASPLMPATQPLEERAAELAQSIVHDPAEVAGVNIAGFGSDELRQHMMNGVTGYILSGPTGSTAVIWTDAAASRSALQPGPSELVWRDEVGQPIKSGTPDLYASPVVIEAKGMPANKLFDALLGSQLKPKGTGMAR